MHSISRFIYPKINYFKNEIKKKGRESLQFLLCVNSFQYLPGGGNSKSVLRGEGRTASKFPESSYRGWNDFLVATPWIKQPQVSRRWVFWTRPGREQKVPRPCAHRHFPARKSLEAYPSAHTCCAPAQRRTDASGGSVQSPNAHPRPAPGGCTSLSALRSLTLQDLQEVGILSSQVYVSFILPLDNSGPFTAAADVRARARTYTLKETRVTEARKPASKRGGGGLTPFSSSFCKSSDSREGRLCTRVRMRVVHEAEVNLAESVETAGLLTFIHPPRFSSLAQRRGGDVKGKRGRKQRLRSGRAMRGCVSGSRKERVKKLYRTGPEALSSWAARS